MAPLYGKVHPGDFILGEDDTIGGLSRDNLTIASGQVLKPGQICGIVTVGGQVKALNTGASTGEDDAACIPIYAYDATGAAVMGAFITRNATVKEDGLIWPNGISAGDKAAAIAQLAARNIIIRPRSYVG